MANIWWGPTTELRSKLSISWNPLPSVIDLMSFSSDCDPFKKLLWFAWLVKFSLALKRNHRYLQLRLEIIIMNFCKTANDGNWDGLVTSCLDFVLNCQLNQTGLEATLEAVLEAGLKSGSGWEFWPAQHSGTGQEHDMGASVSRRC